MVKRSASCYTSAATPVVSCHKASERESVAVQTILGCTVQAIAQPTRPREAESGQEKRINKSEGQ
ncbi:hypothetical protein T4E_4043 [Trichinella pseudospiralis]|uniref:Uncharacterized protein n=1 Tax=Trichinella pseudospiralis TaxID=6337 RepID=A0A0V0Y5N9_TRIPS|nr:hypothetical protein T4E_4043 [Trichinella pseudospiralis]